MNRDKHVAPPPQVREEWDLHEVERSCQPDYENIGPILLCPEGAELQHFWCFFTFAGVAIKLLELHRRHLYNLDSTLSYLSNVVSFVLLGHLGAEL